MTAPAATTRGAGQRLTGKLLARDFPSVAAWFAEDLNADLDVDLLAASSARRVWWRCPVALDHVWLVIVANRTRLGSGCPACAGRQVSTTNSLAALHPSIAAQFDPELNDGLSPNDVPSGSGTRRWWRCPAGPDHTWLTTVHERTGPHRSGCPYCAGQRASVTNSLAARYPRLASEFDEALNNGLVPDQVPAGSARKVRWRCQQGHGWAAPVVRRTAGGTGCPACDGKVLTDANSLSARRPDLATQYDTDRNPEPAHRVVAGSHSQVWWRCDAGPDHTWLTSPSNRVVHGHGCPACAGRQVSITNSLTTLQPGIAAQLDPERNDGLTPDQVASGSSRHLWWRCPHGPDHVWRATPENRAAGRGCPACAGRQPSITNSLATVVPGAATEFDHARNAGRRPEQVIAGSGEKFWWRCPAGPDHAWQAPAATRLSGAGCPACAGRRVSVTNSLATLAPDVAAQLDRTRNHGRGPEKIVAGSREKFWWQCPAFPGHVWRTSVCYRMVGTGCPACAGTGFNADLPGHLYLLERERHGVREQKIGITNYPERRLAVHRRNGWALLDLSPTLPGTLARRTERRLLTWLDSSPDGRVKYRGEDRFDGYTETWVASTLDLRDLDDLRTLLGPDTDHAA